MTFHWASLKIIKNAADAAQATRYIGIAILSSFCTPVIPVNVVDPVNCNAMNELVSGKKRYEIMISHIFC